MATRWTYKPTSAQSYTPHSYTPIESGGGWTYKTPPPATHHVTKADLQHVADSLIHGTSFLHSAEGLGTNFLAGLYETGRASVLDVKNNPESIVAGPFAPIFANVISISSGHGGGHLTKEVAIPTGYAYKNKYYGRSGFHPGAALHNIAGDPFGTLLDALALGTIPVGGEGLAIRGADLAVRVGAEDSALGSRLVRLGDAAARNQEARTIHYTPPGETSLGETAAGSSFEAPRARTLQGRLIYNPIRDALGRAVGGTLPYVGDAARLARFNAKTLEFNMGDIKTAAGIAEYRKLISASVRPTKRLTKAERIAQHIATEYGPDEAKTAELGAPRRQRVEFYKQRLAETLKRLDELKGKANRGNVRASLRAIAETQKHMIDLYSGNARLAAKIDEAVKTPRPILEQVMSTADQIAEQGRQILLDQGYTEAQLEERRFAPQYGLHGYTLSPADEEGNRMWLHPDAVAQEVPAEGAIGEASLGGPKSLEQIRAEHASARYYPNLGPDVTAEGAKLGVVRGSLSKRLPGVAKRYEGVRLATGTVSHGPDAPLRAFAQLLNFKATAIAAEQLRPLSIPVERDGLLKNYVYFNPDAVKISRFQREAQAMHEHLGSLTDEAHNAQIQTQLDEMFPTSIRPGEDVAHLRQVPESFVKAIKKDYKKANVFTKYLVDKPLMIWKALVLKYRPAWLVNNILGQHVLLLLHHPIFWNDYLHSLNPKRRAEFEKGLHGLSMGGTNELIRNDAMHSLGFETSRRGKLQSGEIGGIVGKVAYRAVDYPWKVVKGVGDGIAKANLVIADDMTRFTLARHEVKGYARRQRVKELAHEQRVARGLADANETIERYTVKGKTLEEIARTMPVEAKLEVLRKVNSALGDFNTLHGAGGRRLRRFVPFASWFKVILEISRDLVIEHPEKVWFVYQMEQAAKKNPSVTPSFDVPSWFVGSLIAPWFGTKPGEVPLISTNTANPFSTPVQLAQQLGSLLHQGAPTGTVSPISSLGPAAEAVNLYQGFDPFYGGSYTGPGDKSPGYQRIALGIAAGLPPVRLANEAGLPLTGKYHRAASYNDRFVNVGGHDIPLDAILRYLGLPIRRANRAKLQEYANRGL